MSNDTRITLRDIYDAVNRLEDKLGNRIDNVEVRVNALESFKDNLSGKITLAIGGFSLFFTAIWSWIYDKFFRGK